MRPNGVKRKLARGGTTIGTWLTIGHPVIPRVLGPAGFEWLAVDMEHTTVGLESLPALFMATEAADMLPLVRVGSHDSALIKRVMDAGSYGVIVPDVRTPDQARHAVNSVRYPPFGSRGVGLYIAQGFGRTFNDYVAWQREESLVVIQIEHIDAVTRIDSILSTPGIDAFMVGPYDLSASLGSPGELDSPAVLDALCEIREASKRCGVPPGIHAVASDPAKAIQLAEEGYRFLAYSVDAILLGDAAFEGVGRIREETDA